MPDNNYGGYQFISTKDLLSKYGWKGKGYYFDSKGKKLSDGLWVKIDPTTNKATSYAKIGTVVKDSNGHDVKLGTSSFPTMNWDTYKLPALDELNLRLNDTLTPLGGKKETKIPYKPAISVTDSSGNSVNRRQAIDRAKQILKEREKLYNSFDDAVEQVRANNMAEYGTALTDEENDYITNQAIKENKLDTSDVSSELSKILSKDLSSVRSQSVKIADEAGDKAKIKAEEEYNSKLTPLGRSLASGAGGSVSGQLIMPMALNSNYSTKGNEVANKTYNQQLYSKINEIFNKPEIQQKLQNLVTKYGLSSDKFNNVLSTTIESELNKIGAEGELPKGYLDYLGKKFVQGMDTSHPFVPDFLLSNDQKYNDARRYHYDPRSLALYNTEQGLNSNYKPGNFAKATGTVAENAKGIAMASALAPFAGAAVEAATPTLASVSPWLASAFNIGTFGLTNPITSNVIFPLASGASLDAIHYIDNKTGNHLGDKTEEILGQAVPAIAYGFKSPEGWFKRPIGSSLLHSTANYATTTGALGLHNYGYGLLPEKLQNNSIVRAVDEHLVVPVIQAGSSAVTEDVIRSIPTVNHLNNLGQHKLGIDNLGYVIKDGTKASLKYIWNNKNQFWNDTKTAYNLLKKLGYPTSQAIGRSLFRAVVPANRMVQILPMFREAPITEETNLEILKNLKKTLAELNEVEKAVSKSLSGQDSLEFLRLIKDGIRSGRSEGTEAHLGDKLKAIFSQYPLYRELINEYINAPTELDAAMALLKMSQVNHNLYTGVMTMITYGYNAKKYVEQINLAYQKATGNKLSYNLRKLLERMSLSYFGKDYEGVQNPGETIQHSINFDVTSGRKVPIGEVTSYGTAVDPENYKKILSDELYRLMTEGEGNLFISDLEHSNIEKTHAADYFDLEQKSASTDNTKAGQVSLDELLLNGTVIDTSNLSLQSPFWLSKSRQVKQQYGKDYSDNPEDRMIAELGQGLATGSIQGKIIEYKGNKYFIPIDDYSNFDRLASGKKYSGSSGVSGKLNFILLHLNPERKNLLIGKPIRITSSTLPKLLNHAYHIEMTDKGPKTVWHDDTIRDLISNLDQTKSSALIESLQEMINKGSFSSTQLKDFLDSHPNLIFDEVKTATTLNKKYNTNFTSGEMKLFRSLLSRLGTMTNMYVYRDTLLNNSTPSLIRKANSHLANFSDSELMQLKNYFIKLSRLDYPSLDKYCKLVMVKKLDIPKLSVAAGNLRDWLNAGYSFEEYKQGGKVYFSNNANVVRRLK